MKVLLSLMLMSFNLMAWELPYAKDVQDIRYLPERQEILAQNELGIWRYDVHGRLIRSPSRSTRKLWNQNAGKTPASVTKVAGIYVPTTKQVFVVLPGHTQVQVLTIKDN